MPASSRPHHTIPNFPPVFSSTAMGRRCGCAALASVAWLRPCIHILCHRRLSRWLRYLLADLPRNRRKSEGVFFYTGLPTERPSVRVERPVGSYVVKWSSDCLASAPQRDPHYPETILQRISQSRGRRQNSIAGSAAVSARCCSLVLLAYRRYPAISRSHPEIARSSCR